MRLFTVVLTFLAISWVSVFAAAQDGQPLPKAKLDENLAPLHATQRESIIGSTAIALYGL